MTATSSVPMIEAQVVVDRRLAERAHRQRRPNLH
jgi:hypothetical protein